MVLSNVPLFQSSMIRKLLCSWLMVHRSLYHGFSDNLILDPVQNAVDETSRVLRAISFSEIDGFINGNFGGDVFAVEEFKQSHAEDISVDHVDTV